MSYKEKSFFRSYCCTMIEKGGQFYNIETNQFGDFDLATQFYSRAFAETIMNLLVEPKLNIVEFRIEFHFVGVINNL